MRGFHWRDWLRGEELFLPPNKWAVACSAAARLKAGGACPTPNETWCLLRLPAIKERLGQCLVFIGGVLG